MESGRGGCGEGGKRERREDEREEDDDERRKLKLIRLPHLLYLFTIFKFAVRK